MAGPPPNQSPSPLAAALRRFLDALQPHPGKLVVALSGGPDSAALVHALATLPDRPFELQAAHVNHALRAAASDRDEEWARSYCRDLGFPLVVLDGSLDADDVRHRGIEAAARSVRYRLLESERQRTAADYVATAHTRSDQAETVLLRLLTGRGTWRLSGILPLTDDRVIRPLLYVPREEVRRYLREHGIEPCHDASNDDDRFLRNRIRRDLLPLIEGWNPRIEELLADTAALERDRQRAFDELMEPVRRSLVREEPDSASILLDPLSSPHVLRSLLLEQIRRLDGSTREVDASTLAALTESEPGTSRVISPRLRAECEIDRISIRLFDEPPDPPAAWAYAIVPGETINVPEAGYAISLRDASADGTTVVSPDRLRQVIQTPLESPVVFEIRTRKPGDRFRPLGMNQDKNLADFLSDRRIPVEERDSLPLLVCNDSIAWIAGVEVGDEFKVRSTPGRRLEIVAERIEGCTHEWD